MEIYEPFGYEEAFKDPKWKKAMEEEMSKIQKNKTWELVDRPEGRKIIGVKWVYRIKLNADCSINKYKASYLLRGMHRFFVLTTLPPLLMLLDFWYALIFPLMKP